MTTLTRPKTNFISTRNACKLCSPLGACMVMRGIENCIPLIHGSQGCATYIRRYGISHFREPLDIASSNFVETTAIFGGQENLFKALDNVVRQYQPAAIGITSTCLSETMGEDVELYLREYAKLRRHSLLPLLFYASTPSYRGTHVDGFNEAVRAVIKATANNEYQKINNDKPYLNLISPFVSCEDVREFHRILQAFNIPYTLLPDYSETLDGAAWRDYQKIPKGGTTLEDIAKMKYAKTTITFNGDAATLPLNNILPLPLPIGVENTDKFFDALKKITSREPTTITSERGRLIDAYFDGHKYVSGKRAIVYGDKIFVAALKSFLEEIGVNVVLAADGAETDFETMLETIKNGKHNKLNLDDKPDFIIGNSKGLYLSRALGIPLVRCGFPIHDRMGGHRILHVGYRGTLNLFERICNTLIEYQQNQESFGWTYV
jgi:nitrogenase molybdenum-iron protein NifN